MNNSRTVAIAAVVLAFGAGAFAYLQSTPSKQLYSSSRVAFTGPINPSESEIVAFNQAVANGTTVPPGWTITQDEGKVKVVDTGIALQQSGERAWVVTVVDQPSDLASATVFLDSAGVYTATHGNGGIVDRQGFAIATLPVLVPPPGQGFELGVSWTATDGTTTRSESALTQ